jgi:hypothetical protein
MSSITCPGCGTGYQIEAGQIVVCEICRRELHAPDEPSQQPAPVENNDPLLEAADEPPAPDVPASPAATPHAIPTAKPLAPETRAKRPAPAAHTIPTATPIADATTAVKAVATVTAVSPAVQPPQAETFDTANEFVGESDSYTHYEYERQRRSPLSAGLMLLAMLLLSGIAAVLLVAVLTGKLDLRIESPQPEQQPPPEAVAADVVNQTRDTGEWTNAAEKALRINQIRVRVVRAEWGHARGKDESNAVVISPGEYLTIALNIENQKSEDIVYRSWYTHGSERVRLKDDRGNSYALVHFGDVQKVRWHVDEQPLEPLNDLNDVLIFQIPGDRSGIQHFELELSPEATGTQWGYRFLVPRSMIRDF